MRSPALFLALAMSLAACSGGLRDGVFAKEGVRYQVGPMPEKWRVIELADNDVALVSTDSPHSIAVNSTCRDHGDPSLEVLTAHLLIGFTDRERLSSEAGTLDGRASLSSHYRARLDGVAVELLLVVMKKDGCAFDFSYVSPAGRFDERRGDFDSVLTHFKSGAPR